MTGIKIGGTAIKIAKKEIESYEKYIVNTYNYIAKELNLEVRSIGGGSFIFEDALAFRIIQDDKETSLDRSIELRIDKNSILYLDTILGSIQLKTLSSAGEFKNTIKQLNKLNFIRHDDKVYTATVDISGYTLPNRENSKNSDEISDIIKDLPSKIFDKKDALYKLGHNPRTENNVVIDFHSEVYEGHEDSILEDESPTVTNEEQQATDQNQKKETTTTTNSSTQESDDNSTGDHTVEIPSDAAVNKTVIPPQEIKINITLVENSTTNASSETPNSTTDQKLEEASAVALPNIQTTWAQWIYDNMYPIIGTVICIVGGAALYKYTNRASASALPTSDYDLLHRGSPLYTGTTLSSHTDSSERFFEDDSISPIQAVRGTSVHDSPEWGRYTTAHANQHETSFISGILSPVRTGVTFALNTAKKTTHRLSISSHERMIEDAADQILDRYTTLEPEKYGSNMAHWLQGDNKIVFFKENFIQLLNDLTLKNRIKNAHELASCWRDGLKNKYTLDFDDTVSQTGRVTRKGFNTIFNDTKLKTLDIIKKLHITLDDDNKCPGLAGMDYNAIYNMLKDAGNNGHLLYLIIMGMTIEDNIVAAEDNIDLLKNNNATEWHSLSMVTEADFADENSEDDVIYDSDNNTNTNYNTHPQLILKTLAKVMESHHESEDSLELGSLSDGNMQCRFALKKTMSDTVDALHIANMLKGGVALKDLFSLSYLNQFVIIPQLLSAAIADEAVDELCNLAEYGYESALKLLGIEDSSE